MLNFSLTHDISASRADHYLSGANRKRQKQLVVPAITLDAFVERNNIERVDFIKADIEGAERNMLRGAKRILREFAPKLSICTYHLPDRPLRLRTAKPVLRHQRIHRLRSTEPSEKPLGAVGGRG
jgi:hypothetical protein